MSFSFYAWADDILNDKQLRSFLWAYVEYKQSLQKVATNTQTSNTVLHQSLTEQPTPQK